MPSSLHTRWQPTTWEWKQLLSWLWAPKALKLYMSVCLSRVLLEHMCLDGQVALLFETVCVSGQTCSDFLFCSKSRLDDLKQKSAGNHQQVRVWIWEEMKYGSGTTLRFPGLSINYYLPNDMVIIASSPVRLTTKVFFLLSASFFPQVNNSGLCTLLQEIFQILKAFLFLTGLREPMQPFPIQNLNILWLYIWIYVIGLSTWNEVHKWFPKVWSGFVSNYKHYKLLKKLPDS